MKFVKLTRSVLLSLKEQGYNVLRSNSPMTEEKTDVDSRYFRFGQVF